MKPMLRLVRNIDPELVGEGEPNDFPELVEMQTVFELKRPEAIDEADAPHGPPTKRMRT